MPMNVAIIDSSIEALDLLYLHIISAHDGEMDVVPLPSSHLAGQRYDLGRTFQARGCEENISVDFTLTTQSCNGMQRQSQLVKLDRSIVIMLLCFGWCCRTFWLLGWWVCRSFRKLSALVDGWIEITCAWP